jgi:hypothetical protein
MRSGSEERPQGPTAVKLSVATFVVALITLISVAVGPDKAQAACPGGWGAELHRLVGVSCRKASDIQWDYVTRGLDRSNKRHGWRCSGEGHEGECWNKRTGAGFTWFLEETSY